MSEPESNLVSHARRELELLGQTAEDPAFSDALVRAVAAFASYGHSGSSAAWGAQMLGHLLRFEALSPLTTDPEEWLNVSDHSGSEMWQSVRDPACFSVDGGQTGYRLCERGRREPLDLVNR